MSPELSGLTIFDARYIDHYRSDTAIQCKPPRTPTRERWKMQLLHPWPSRFRRLDLRAAIRAANRHEPVNYETLVDCPAQPSYRRSDGQRLTCPTHPLRGVNLALRIFKQERMCRLIKSQERCDVQCREQARHMALVRRTFTYVVRTDSVHQITRRP